MFLMLAIVAAFASWVWRLLASHPITGCGPPPVKALGPPVTGADNRRISGGRPPDKRRRAGGLHPQQLDLEDQDCVGRDDAAGAARAIAELGGDDQRALAAHLHARHTLVPAFDHLAA